MLARQAIIVGRGRFRLADVEVGEVGITGFAPAAMNAGFQFAGTVRPKPIAPLDLVSLWP